MKCEAIEIAGGWAVRKADGCLLSENGHSFLSGNGFGCPKIWTSAPKARAVAEWLSTEGRARLSNSQRRELRRTIVEKHGLPAETARGLLQ